MTSENKAKNKRKKASGKHARIRTTLDPNKNASSNKSTTDSIIKLKGNKGRIGLYGDE